LQHVDRLLRRRAQDTSLTVNQNIEPALQVAVDPDDPRQRKL
jgi:hypothetical protein